MKIHSIQNFDKSDASFKTFQTAVDNLFKQLTSDGIGAEARPTEGISTEEEAVLWETGTLNVTTPKGLLRAAFFVCGKCFCLRGGEEHRALGLSQLQRLKNPNRYVYVENSSKNRPGGLNQMKLSHKSVTIVASDSSGDKCPVFILDMYISKLPAAAREKDLFYCRPLAVTPKGIDDSWYVAMPVGKNVLSKMVAEMCSDAGIHGRKTNHSLRVAGVSSLFDAGVPERIIQQRSGHRSLEGLRVYERVTQQQQEEVSKILAGDSKKFSTT